MLQKMFPREGETVPEIRFPGFKEEWESKKFYDYLISTPSKTYLTEAGKIGKYPVIQQGNIPIAGYSSNPPFLNYHNVVLFGDHTLSIYKPKGPFLLASDGIKILSIENFSNNFLFQVLKRYMPKSEGYKRHFNILKKGSFCFPSKSEQQKIGAFFENLDNLISFHQREYDKLKELKKGLLQQMFV